MWYARCVTCNVYCENSTYLNNKQKFGLQMWMIFSFFLSFCALTYCYLCDTATSQNIIFNLYIICLLNLFTFFLFVLFQYVYLGRLRYGIGYQRNETNVCCSFCWCLNNTLSGWRLSPFYIALGVALLMWPNSLWLSSVVGVQLLLLAILRLFTVIRYQNSTNKCETLLQKQPNNREYFEK